MANTLQEIKKKLNIDQRNLVTARVLSISNASARVRLPDGSERTAYAPDGATVGSMVSVAIAGNTASISGSANVQATGGMKTVILS